MSGNIVKLQSSSGLMSGSQIFENFIDGSFPLLLSKEQLAQKLNISPRTITGWRYKYNSFPAKKVGRHVRFFLPDVLDWLDGKFGARH